jgi:hypothetical protein
MKSIASWVCVILSTSIATGCAQREAQFPLWEANRQAILNAAPPPVPTDAQTTAAENAYRACLVKAARYADSGSAAAKSSDASDLATLIAPMCYPQFSAFEAAAAASFSDRDRSVFYYAGDQRQIALASEAIRAERGQAASTDSAQPSMQAQPSPSRD